MTSLNYHIRIYTHLVQLARPFEDRILRHYKQHIGGNDDEGQIGGFC